MRLDRAGLPFVAATAGPALGLCLVQQWGWGAAFAALAAAATFFFRDPERRVPHARGAVVAPADGRVLVAGPSEDAAGPPGVWQQVSIFLSPLDVHVNRVPIGGRVVRIERREGGFAPAYRRDAARNAHTEIWFDCDGTPVVVRQVVGVLARRIVCRLTEGQVVATGARLGVMKFGSRMDVFLPPSATLAVRVGDRVRAGETIVALLPT
jgi:phosphatidylserine decarboxylase